MTNSAPYFAISVPPVLSLALAMVTSERMFMISGCPHQDLSTIEL